MGSYNEEYARDNSGYFESFEFQMSRTVLQKHLLSNTDTKNISLDYIRNVMRELREKDPPFNIYGGIEYEIKLILERGGYKVE